MGMHRLRHLLAPLGEAKLRSGLMMTAGGIEPLFTRPLALTFLLIAIFLLLWSLYSEWQQRNNST